MKVDHLYGLNTHLLMPDFFKVHIIYVHTIDA